MQEPGQRLRSRHECMSVEGRVAHVRADGRFMLDIAEDALCRGCSGACLWRKRGDFECGPFVSRRRLAPGARVRISLPARTFVTVSLVTHGLPWAGLLVGAVAGGLLFATDAAAVIGAVASFAAGIFAVSVARERLERAVTRQLVVREIP